MAIREIRQKEDVVLRKISKEVKEFDSKLEMILQDMEDTMIEKEGVGIAAIQIGILKRIFLANIDDKIIEFINPKILEKKGSQINEEGCLSAVGETGNVERATYIKVQAYNRLGEQFIYEAEDFEAIIISHEYDHLDGILYLDKVIESDEI